MIFVGDIASPGLSSSICLSKVFTENRNIFSGKRLICNFEGLIFDGQRPKSNDPVLYNHSSILSSLEHSPKPVLCLANNHILDLPGQFGYTISLLTDRDFLYCGAGRNLNDAEVPAVFNDGGRKVILLNACWDFLLYKYKNPREGIYVNVLQEKKLIDRVLKYKKEFPDSAVVVYLHWSLDLEILPYPMFRKFSIDLIDSGANIIIGAHSHCLQGGEKYRNGYIIYGLGNFFLPNNIYADSNLSFPDFARIQLAFEWDIHSNDAVCHWFEYLNTNHCSTLVHLESAGFNESERMKEYSKFQGLNSIEYLTYFKKNRRKSFMIPVYTDYNKTWVNRRYTFFLKNRARFAHTLARLHLIKWQN